MHLPSSVYSLPSCIFISSITSNFIYSSESDSPKAFKKSVAVNYGGAYSPSTFADALNLDSIAVVDHSESEHSDEFSKKGTALFPPTSICLISLSLLIFSVGKKHHWYKGHFKRNSSNKDAPIIPLSGDILLLSPSPPLPFSIPSFKT